MVPIKRLTRWVVFFALVAIAAGAIWWFWPRGAIAVGQGQWQQIGPYAIRPEKVYIGSVIPTGPGQPPPRLLAPIIYRAPFLARWWVENRHQPTYAPIGMKLVYLKASLTVPEAVLQQGIIQCTAETDLGEIGASGFGWSYAPPQPAVIECDLDVPEAAKVRAILFKVGDDQVRFPVSSR